MKIFSIIRHQMTPLFALRYLFLARPNGKEPVMSRKIQFACLFLLLGLLSAPTQSSFAQNAASQNNVNFSGNLFVTGDYAVGGVSLIGKGSGGLSTGTISIGGDPNPGVKGTNSVPPGAQVVAALLYWQTIETLGVTPGQVVSGQAVSGQSGTFRPLINGGPQTGYSIQGTALPNSTGTINWDASGCNITSSKQLVTYRAEVRAFLPQDASGNVLANGSYEVRLPSQTNSSGSGSNTSGTPNTIGATLVIIYRVLSPNFPLNSIVIYDGTYAPTTTSLTTMQTVQGFYQAAANPVSKLTYIVSGGVGSLKETVSLNNVSLPSLYGNQPPFPGWYPGGHWDNPSWIFPSTANPVLANDFSATTVVNNVKQGCVATAAIIFSTTVKNTDGDGLLDSWKTNHGYCDASFNEAGNMSTPFSCTSAGSQWVDLTGATPGHKDVFLQLDYMCYGLDPNSPNGCDMSTTITNPLTQATPSVAPDGTKTTTYTVTVSTPFPVNQFVTISGFINPKNNGNFIVGCVGDPVVNNNVATCTGNQIVVNNPNGMPENNPATAKFTAYSFDPRQVTDTITGKNSFAEVSDVYAGRGITLHPDWHAMQETPGCQDSTVVINNVNVPSYCPYLNQPGLVGWKGGFDALKGQPLNMTEALCEASPATCVRRFQHGRKDSYHEVIFGHAQGGPEWSFLTGTLTSVVVTSGNLVTFTTSTPHGLAQALSTTDQNPLARVTVSDALTNTILSGTYLVHSVTPDGLSFTIQVTPIPAKPLCPTSGCTRLTDPSLSVASGRIHTRSGFSDVGGADSLVTLGRWDPVLAQQVTGTTFMHEFGHGEGLTHSGFFFDQLTSTNNNYIPTVEANCKPNFQSVMNYPFQLNHIDNGAKKVLDYSVEQLDTLNESSLPAGVTKNLNQPFYKQTLWYSQTPFGNSPQAKLTCEGFPVPQGTPPTYLVSGPADPIPQAFWGTKQDIDFNLKVDTQLRGHSDWTNVVAANGLVISPGMNLLQIGATGADAFGSGGSLGPGGGSLGPGGGSLGPGGGSLGPGGGSLGPGGGSLGPGGGSLGPGGGSLGPGGGSLGPGGGIGEVDFATATAVTYPPSDLTAMEGALDAFGTPQPSPRTITLNWAAGFGLTGAYRIYRSDDGGHTFNVIATVTGNPPATTFQDTVTCNPTNGHQYFVTAVQSNSSPNPGQESGPTNTVTTGQNGEKLTGCYTVTAFSSPTSAVQGSTVVITWTLTDTSNQSGTHVTRKEANTLVAIGPVPGNCTTQHGTTLLADGIPTNAADNFNNSDNQFTFTWNNTDAFCSGSYAFELDLDHVNGSPAQVQPDPTQLQLGIDVTDTDGPHVPPVAMTNGVVGTPYSNTILEDGGVSITGNPFTWIVLSSSFTGFSSSIPLPGISLGTAADGVSGLLSGTPTTAGIFNFTVQVTDSVGNIGTQTLTMTVTTPVAQINQPLVPDSSVPGGATFVLTLNGAGFGPGSQVLWNGTSPVTTFISNKQLTAVIPASDVTALGTASVSVSNPVTVGNKAVPNSNIDFFQITNPTTAVSLSRANYATGVNPNGLISADFKADGNPELAVANSGGNTVSILLGNSNGTFEVGTTLVTGSVPWSLTAGDFNGDGRLDLAVTNANFNNGPGTVSIYLGNGDGTFQSPATSAVGNAPTSVATGDFNRDGKLDLAVANQNDHSVSILLGNGDGTFQSQVPYPAGVAGALDVANLAVGDFNRDGKLDLAVTNPSSDQVSILLGNGDGTFQGPVAYSTGAPVTGGNHPIAVAAADLNGDGKLDLAVTNLNTNKVAIFLGNGDGTFALQASYSTTSGAMTGPSAMTTGDFNGDGKVDLAITNQHNSVSILLGNGNGTFQGPLEFATGNLSAGVAAGDFNGDGRLDVAVANFSDYTVSVMLQPQVLLVPSAVAFGSVAVSTPSAPSPVGLTNNGPSALTISNIGFAGSNPGDFSETDNCPASPSTLAPGLSCTINVKFTPTQFGPRKATLTITDSASDSPQSVGLSGSGFIAPAKNLTAVASAGQVALNWTASTSGDVVGYNVYRAPASGGPYNLIQPSVAGTNFTDSTVSSGTTYFYVITAADASNNESPFSNEASATTP